MRDKHPLRLIQLNYKIIMSQQIIKIIKEIIKKSKPNDDELAIRFN